MPAKLRKKVEKNNGCLAEKVKKVECRQQRPPYHLKDSVPFLPQVSYCNASFLLSLTRNKARRREQRMV
jgi:hypothetical protein